MFKIRTLIVEDDAGEQANWEGIIEYHNAQAEEHGFEITPTIAATAEQAKAIIASGNFDAAIVDIRLKREDGHSANTDGNDALEAILQSEMAAVAIFTGEAALATPPGEMKGVVQIFTKGGGEGEGNTAVMAWLKSQAIMIEYIQSAQRRIQEEMAAIFSKSIWPRWNNWTRSTPSGESVGDAVLRHITSHVYASLLEKGEHKVHPEEWYFIPPVREGIRTGDLLEISPGSFEVVVTPRCDLARNDKNETIQLAQCMDISEEWNAQASRVSSAEEALAATQPADANRASLERRVKTERGELRKLTQHKSASVYHFLPRVRLKEKTVGPFMVRFDKVRSVLRTDDSAMRPLIENRIAAITPEFLPSLVERLGTFFSRIGTPDYDHQSEESNNTV